MYIYIDMPIYLSISIYLYIHTYTHTTMYIYIYVCVCISPTVSQRVAILSQRTGEDCQARRERQARRRLGLLREYSKQHFKDI